MREFMTKMSDYWKERRNDPDKQENKLTVIITAAVAVVIIVLLLVLLWGYVGKRYGGRETALPEQTEQVMQEADQKENQKETDDEGISKVVHEEEAVRYMSEDSGEKLRQEYLTSTAYLKEKVEELLQTMTQVQDGLQEVEKEYKAGDSALQTQIITMREQVDTIVLSLKETQIKLTDLTNTVQIIDKEKIPVIQEQIAQIRGDMEHVQTDIADLYEKMAALKKEDERLWASISKLEKTVKAALDQNVAEVNNRLNQLQAGMEHLKQEFEKILQENMAGVNERVDVLISQMEERLGALTENTLRYRYEAQSNTLYLSPMKEEAGQ